MFATLVPRKHVTLPRHERRHLKIATRTHATPRKRHSLLYMLRMYHTHSQQVTSHHQIYNSFFRGGGAWPSVSLVEAVRMAPFFAAALGCRSYCENLKLVANGPDSL